MRPETKVGLLFILSIGLIVLFAYYLGVLNPFSNSDDLFVTYNFAGGIEIGSPVRVMGIKVGKVKSIQFDPHGKDEQGNEVKLKLNISIGKKAWATLRKDSKFFINLAGVIGEKFLEITPGSLESPALVPGETLRGEDPPRIDQLISQSYGLAGKIIEFVERNEGSVSETIARLESLVVNFNKTLRILDQASKNKKMALLFDNSIKITDNLAVLTAKMTAEDAQKTYDLVHRLLWRLEGLDAKEIRKFLQEEGIRAKIF